MKLRIATHGDLEERRIKKEVFLFTDNTWAADDGKSPKIEFGTIKINNDQG